MSPLEELRHSASHILATALLRIFPDAKLDISRVRNMDARVSYRAAHVRTERLPLRGLAGVIIARLLLHGASAHPTINHAPTQPGLRQRPHFWAFLAEFALPFGMMTMVLHSTNTAALDYYLLPQFEMRTKSLGLAEENGLMLDAFRFQTLDFFFDTARRVPVSEVAPW